LIGQLNHGFVTYCYSTATVAGRGSVGGLVGQSGFDDGGSAAPDVTPLPSTIVTRCYSAGVVSGSQNVGGLLGLVVFGDVSHSFWDIQTSGQAVSAAGTGKTTAEMKDPKTFQAAGWDFVGQADGPQDIWTEPAGAGYPILWWQLLPLVDLPRFSGGSGEPNDPYMISTVDELCRIGHNPRLMRCHFGLANDLDLLGSHFYPIGGPAFPYTATFNGNGHTISHLTITGESHLGLFGQLGWGAQVRDLGVVDVNLVSSAYYVGGLAGKNAGGSVVSCYSSGVLGDTGEWSQCVGGLVGYNSGSISASHSNGAVTGTVSVGGLVGFNSGTIATSYSRGLVCGGGYAYVGGLVGSNRGAIATSCSRASVSSTDTVVVGGLVGENGGSIAASYSRGSVNGSQQLGGLVGYNWGGKIATSYSTGTVSGIYLVGGLVGPNSGSIAASFWDTQTSGQARSAGGTGKTTAEMQTASTFLDAGWDFVGETDNGTADIWWIDEGKDYPRLRWEGLPVTELDAASFDARIAEGVVLVDFYATWCSACARQAPILEEVADRLQGRAQVAKLDVDKAHGMAQHYGVTAIPTLIVFQEGVEVRRFIGVTNADDLVAAVLAAVGSLEQPAH